MKTSYSYKELISIKNLFQAWNEFKKGKRKKYDVQRFEYNLEDNLFELHLCLKTKTYRHGSYSEFYVNDPKRRHIHKASVQDRIVHHLLYKYLYEVFDKTFIYDSYSCRLNKGTHRAVKRLKYFVRKVSCNYTSSCFALKCDIKKFFANVDHEILKSLISRKVKDTEILWLISEVIDSFSSDIKHNKGIPLGNLTSQIFANIYMNEFDQFLKHKLKIKYFLRYADDFIFLANKREFLFPCIDTSQQVLNQKLKLELHPNKIIIKKLSRGIDFCGYVVLPHYILPRTTTKKRMFRKIDEKIRLPNFNQTLASYLGYLKHANAYRIRKKLLEKFDIY